MATWWPLPWMNPPAGANFADVTLANGKMFRIYDDVSTRAIKNDVYGVPKRITRHSTTSPLIRYEIRQTLDRSLNGRMSPKYTRAATLLEVLAYLIAEEQTDELLSE